MGRWHWYSVIKGCFQKLFIMTPYQLNMHEEEKIYYSLLKIGNKNVLHSWN